jgi:hypothetical protein
MIRNSLFILALAFSSLAGAQTLVKISDLTLSEKEDVRRGTDLTAQLPEAEGVARVMLYADQHITAQAKVKVSTHNVRRSSVKDGAVNLIFDVELVVDGIRDKRRVERIFYAEQERKATIEEKFTIKQGIDMRVVTLAFVVEVL